MDRMDGNDAGADDAICGGGRGGSGGVHRVRFPVQAAGERDSGNYTLCRAGSVAGDSGQAGWKDRNEHRG